MPRPHRPRPGRRSATPPRAPTAMAPGAGPARPAHPLRTRTRTRGRSWVVVRRRSQIAHPRRDRACAAPWKHLPWLARRVPSAREPGVAQAVTALASPFRRTIPFPRKRARQANRTGSVDHGSFPPRVPCRHVGSPGSALARSPCQPPPATSGSRRRCRSCPGACAPCGRLWQPGRASTHAQAGKLPALDLRPPVIVEHPHGEEPGPFRTCAPSRAKGVGARYDSRIFTRPFTRPRCISPMFLYSSMKRWAASRISAAE